MEMWLPLWGKRGSGEWIRSSMGLQDFCTWMMEIFGSKSQVPESVSMDIADMRMGWLSFVLSDGNIKSN